MGSSTSADKPFSLEQLHTAIDQKAKPPGSLGRIEELAIKIGMLQQSLKPRMQRCGLIIFAADHGIAASGVSRYPQEVTQQMVHNFLTGRAAANVIAKAVGVSVQVVDAGVAGEPIKHADLVSRRLGSGTANFADQPAMTSEQFDRAIEHGRELGASGDFDALCHGEMGIANTSSATMICHKLLGLPLGDITGRGTGLDDAGVARKFDVLQEAAGRTAITLPAREAMLEYGGFEIAMMAGAMLGAAEARRVVTVDGFIATAAAAVALHIEPESQLAMVFAHESAEHGHAAVVAALGVEPLLDLNLRLGEGTGALLAWPIIKSAAAMLCDMASFDSAGISGAR